MSGTKDGASRERLVGAILLVIEHSELRDIAGGGTALRDILDMRLAAMLQGGRLHLQPLWSLLEAQPGFDAARALPPLCLLKGWERRLEVEVVLPEAACALSDPERRRLAGACRVPSGEMHRLFRGGESAGAPGPAGKRRRRAGATTQRPSSRDVPPPPGRDAGTAGGRRRGLLWVSTAVTAIAAGVVGTAIYPSCRGPAFEDIGVEFAGEIPVATAERIGAQVGVTLGDPGWLELPRETRRDQLGRALRALEPEGVRVLFVEGEGGRVRASAQLHGEPPRIDYVLP